MPRRQHLPEKPCVICGKPMSWRKKWSKVWEDVKYCSERCRRKKISAKSDLERSEEVK